MHVIVEDICVEGNPHGAACHKASRKKRYVASTSDNRLALFTTNDVSDAPRMLSHRQIYIDSLARIAQTEPLTARDAEWFRKFVMPARQRAGISPFIRQCRHGRNKT